MSDIRAIVFAKQWIDIFDSSPEIQDRRRKLPPAVELEAAYKKFSNELRIEVDAEILAERLRRKK